MMKKKKKKSYLKFFLLLFAILLIGFFSYQNFFKKNVIQVVSEIDDYSYFLENNETKIYKKYYKELEKELGDKKVNEENYAKLITTLFLIDFYTLSNKVTNQDIGGIQFLYDDIQDNFKLKATDTLYKYVKSDIYGNRSQELPTVKDVEIENVETKEYSYLDKKDKNAFIINAKIIYKKDLGYDKEKTLIVIHDDIKLSIVEIK